MEMCKILYFFSLFAVYVYAFSANEWMYYKHYPWVWDNQGHEWLYLLGSSDGKIIAYHNNDQKWREFRIENSTDSNSSYKESSDGSSGNDASEEELFLYGFNPDKTWNVRSASYLEMIWVEPGSFKMGGQQSQHSVQLTKGFYLGKFEVTQREYASVMNTNKSLRLARRNSNSIDDFIHDIGETETIFDDVNIETIDSSSYDIDPYSTQPVEQVSWNDVQVFLAKLNEMEAENIPVGWSYVLPTEAQWEYACRAGTHTIYSWGDDINSSLAHYMVDASSQSFAETSKPVGSFQPNPWGFYDMIGNVSEWCNDWYGLYEDYGAYNTELVIDPTGMKSGLGKVHRGGSFLHPSPDSVRRYYLEPELKNVLPVGFRLCLAPPR